ncbi:MAG: carbonic anhydrase [Acidobacteriaceae bacterium]
MDQILEQLKAGVRRFQSEVYPRQSAIYEQAAVEEQTPHTLFIACADSRIDPVAITSSSTGEIFVARNIGNLVPAYGEMLGGVSAVVEFAVASLGVRHIVICGHLHCGAMQALLEPDSIATMPTVQRWMNNAHTALSVAQILHQRAEQNGAHTDIMQILTEQNVLLQMHHLKTHPSVAAALAKDALTISGWIYNIGTGEVRIAPDGRSIFEPL